jgi:hypothetical protein
MPAGVPATRRTAPARLSFQISWLMPALIMRITSSTIPGNSISAIVRRLAAASPITVVFRTMRGGSRYVFTPLAVRPMSRKAVRQCGASSNAFNSAPAMRCK